MNNIEIMNQYQLWLVKAKDDPDIERELLKIRGDQIKIIDAFYKNLSFGTGGLRGFIGAGTNRMNIYTVAKASQGLANYIMKQFPTSERKVAIAYDSRIKSDLFAKVTACVLAANGINVYIYPMLMPTPCLSFAVRHLQCAAGVMITASHNPSNYNGYKVYDKNGCQTTLKTTQLIFSEINKLDIFTDIRKINFDDGLLQEIIRYIPNHAFTAYIENVKKASLFQTDADIDRTLSIVYSPLNGTGLKPVLYTLKELGYTNITVVEEQKDADGNFPTCPRPNPELKEAMDLGIKYAAAIDAPLFLATDPDCDRVGIAVRTRKGNYTLLSGNEIGVLLLDYICSMRTKLNLMPEDPVIVKSIVTTNMAEKIASHYGVRTINVVTGFKYIGEQIECLSAEGKEQSFVFGLEESLGYLSGTYVRDKDGVNGVCLICEMSAYYKIQGVSLLDRLEDLYKLYGFYLETLHTYDFEGYSGAEEMQTIMDMFRSNISAFGPIQILRCLDYLEGLDGLPKSDVIKFLLCGNSSIVIRPSGTEPKIKVYLSVCAINREAAQLLEIQILKEVELFLHRPFSL